MSRAEIFWNLFARRYSGSPVKDMKGYEKTLDDTRKYLTRKSVVLEIGCGTGTTALKLADSVKEMTATDVSSNMIAIGKQKAKKQKIQNIHFERATLSEINQSYDVIIAFNLIHLLEDKDASIKKINELLKPGGLFISKTPCLRESRLMPLLAFFIRMVIGPINCFTVAEFKETIANEGFEIIDSYVYLEKPPRLFAVARKVIK